MVWLVLRSLGEGGGTPLHCRVSGARVDMSMKKVSIRFFNDREIRAVWDDAAAKWRFSVLDVVGALNGEPDYEKTRNYWKYLKAKLKREGNELGSVTTQLRFAAPDGKMRLASVMDADQIVALAKAIPNNKSAAFLDWFLYSDTTTSRRISDAPLSFPTFREKWEAVYPFSSSLWRGRWFRPA